MPQAIAPYCSPAQYLAQFGAAEATQLLQDEARNLMQAHLEAVIASSENGIKPSLAGDELRVATASFNRLVKALNSCSKLMDSYLRSAVSLPLSAEQRDLTDLETCCAELARCWLADDSDNSTELLEKRCERWRAWLRDVSAKRVTLLPPSDTANVSSGETRHGVGKTLTDWRGYPYS